MGAGRTLGPTPEESAMRREMNRLQVEMMKADLRLHNAQADLAEFAAARAHAELQDYLAQRAKPAKSGGKLSAPRPGRTQPTRRENRVSHPAPGGLTKR